MEALLRTGLVCTVIVIVFATEAAGGRKEDESAQSQGKWRELGLIVTLCWILRVRPVPKTNIE